MGDSHPRPSGPDPTTAAGIDIGQRWKDCFTGDHFLVRRTYRDNAVNPTFLIEYASRGPRTVTLDFITTYCVRAEAEKDAA